MTNDKKCLWRIIYEENEKGIGTSFKDKTIKDLICFDCDGYNIRCDKYVVIEDNYLKQEKEN